MNLKENKPRVSARESTLFQHTLENVLWFDKRINTSGFGFFGCFFCRTMDLQNWHSDSIPYEVA